MSDNLLDRRLQSYLRTFFDYLSVDRGLSPNTRGSDCKELSARVDATHLCHLYLGEVNFRAASYHLFA
jgi:hypothetical protein